MFWKALFKLKKQGKEMRLFTPAGRQPPILLFSTWAELVNLDSKEKSHRLNTPSQKPWEHGASGDHTEACPGRACGILPPQSCFFPPTVWSPKNRAHETIREADQRNYQFRSTLIHHWISSLTTSGTTWPPTVLFSSSDHQGQTTLSEHRSTQRSDVCQQHQGFWSAQVGVIIPVIPVPLTPSVIFTIHV